MTAMMRQICKQILTIPALLLLLAAAALPAAAASVVERIVTDPLTGIAMEGYDPVSYFTEPEPLAGSPEYEYYWGGVPWYFASPANRDVFMRAPDVYAPQFGGHCGMSLARGYLSDGQPRIYLIDKLKLYFFYSAANREAFLLSKEEASSKAAAHWPVLAAELSGPDTTPPAVDPDAGAAETEEPASDPAAPAAATIP